MCAGGGKHRVPWDWFFMESRVMVKHFCKPNTWEAEAQGQLEHKSSLYRADPISR